MLQEMERRAKMGLLLFAPQRFADIGAGSARGSYLERKQAEAEQIRHRADEIADVTYSGIVWNTADVCRSIQSMST